MKPVEPIHTLDLFAALQDELIVLLRSLPDSDWTATTACPGWTVKDVAAHLLDGDVRRLSLHRDRLPPVQPQSPIRDYADLVAFLNRLNAEWVQAAQRISPRLLVDLLEWAGMQVIQYLRTLDANAAALFPVSWAGEDLSANWFDIAREYTEKWHHQMHIREAVAASPLTDRRWLHPVIDTFVRGLPYTLRDVPAAEGASIRLQISGAAGGVWTLLRQDGAWQLYSGKAAADLAQVRMDAGVAWRLFTKALSPAQARPHVHLAGDETLGFSLLNLVAIMA